MTILMKEHLQVSKEILAILKVMQQHLFRRKVKPKNPGNAYPKLSRQKSRFSRLSSKSAVRSSWILIRLSF